MEDKSVEPRQSIFSLKVSANVTRDMVIITEFNVTKLTDDILWNPIFENIKENQNNIFEKIILWIRLKLGFNCEFRFEETEKNDTTWNSPSPT